MRKFVFALLFIFAFIPAGFSADPIAVDAARALPIKNPASFSMIVTKSGTLIAKPEALLAEGGDYRGIQLPYLVSTPKSISYPAWAAQEKWEGRFVIAVEILTDGRIGRRQIMTSTGHSTLDEAATQAVLSWKFHPATKSGKPIVECIQIPIIFSLSSE